MHSNAAEAEKLPPKSKVVRLEASPTSVELASPYASAQLLVTATLDSGESVDATRIVTFAPPGTVATISAAGLVRPKADGRGEIVAELGGRKIVVPVRVTGQTDSAPVSFVKDVQPVLSKLGCNGGTCHGAQAGKNGFKLSLRGYDPLYDHRALTDDLEARRFNRAAPDRSLMLLKPAGGVPHVGGVLWQPREAGYEAVKSWIAAGVKLDLDAPRVASIRMLPNNPTVQVIGNKQQFAVIATYSDGTTRDVSAEAFLDSSNTDVMTVDKTGLATSVRRGEATMLARYEGAYDASTVVVMGDRSGFTWKPQPVNNAIDDFVDAKLKRIRVELSPLCNDAEFIRRAFIDLTGLPPTAAEVRAFLADDRDAKIKRDELIDKLVGSESYIDQWTNKWGDMLQVNRKFLGDKGATAFRTWIRDAVAKNMPYDTFAHAILTGTGSNIDSPPAAYYKILREPVDVMENTTQLFLAIRFNCNKCHDHPFEKWTQDQYYQMAAYFAQVSRKEDPKFKGQKLGGTAVEGAKPLAEIIDDAKTGEVKHDRTGLMTPPKYPFLHEDLPAMDLPRRGQVAKWITSPKNPYFARSYVNRLWSYLTGVGIIEPVDDIRAGNPATNPELLDYLTNEFTKSGFDTRAIIKLICKSRTYQLSITTNKWNKDDDINYSHAIARRLPAEVLYDAVYRTTGSQPKLPGMPAGARAAQLLDSNIELPGGFLDLLGKPVRESACECERSSTMMLGPILAFVSGPVVGDAVQDPNNAIAKLTKSQKDDAKVVEEIYLSVLNRKPTAKEVDGGVAAIRGAAADHKLLLDERTKKIAAFTAYESTLDAKQKVWEDGLKSQRPTTWTVLTPTTATAKGSEKASPNLEIQPDGSIIASGPTEPVDLYTVVAEVKQKGAITALRLEVLADPSLPAKGPGRAENGNFVLNEFTVTPRPLDKQDDKEAKPLKLVSPQASFEQATFPISNAIDGNAKTGWAISPQFGMDQTAIFKLQTALNTEKGVALTFVLDQRYGTLHVLGKFRLSTTTDKSPKLKATITAELAKVLDLSSAERSKEQVADLRRRYLAQDSEYQRLKAETAKEVPGDPRVLGAQDLTWALLNSPAFLFNR